MVTHPAPCSPVYNPSSLTKPCVSSGSKADPNGLDIHLQYMRELGVPEAVLANNGTKMGTSRSALQCHPDNAKMLPSPDKSGMLKNIAQYYGVALDKMVLFDDTQANLNIARRLGVPYQCAGGECGTGGGYCSADCGITKENFVDGIKLIGKSASGNDCPGFTHAL